MDKYDILATNPLFKGLTKTEIEGILQCLQARFVTYNKGGDIYRIGDEIKSIGIVLSGCVHVTKNDIHGNIHILTNVGPGELFAESYACMQSTYSPINITSTQKSEILFIDVNKILTICSAGRAFHLTLVENLLYILAENNINLVKKIEHITPKSIREKVLSYLCSMAQKLGKFSFEIPFNRQQLADYLMVERSALSNELSKMQKDGIIEYEKNKFIIKRHK
ncbi:Crp/Fnr family transcriptional regulator [Lachnospiraceae bacterium OttesenSCG-928-E19]|nr:Crp/Fnr family transcriptional regulator [Lachnospiraceae bacterium OttesenSCG-928-E19]